MSWNGRILRQEDGHYRMIECEYDDAGNIIDFCDAVPVGESPMEVISYCTILLQEARDSLEWDSILTEDELPD